MDKRKTCPICSSPNQVVELLQNDMFLFCSHIECDFRSLDPSQTLNGFSTIYESVNAEAKCKKCQKGVMSCEENATSNQNIHCDVQLNKESVVNSISENKIPPDTSVSNNNKPTALVNTFLENKTAPDMSVPETKVSITDSNKNNIDPVPNPTPIVIPTVNNPTSSRAAPVADSSVDVLLSAQDVVSSIDIQSLKFPIWPNKDALCWLNSALALLFHSCSLKRHLQQNPNQNSKISSLLNDYNNLFVQVNSSNKPKPFKNFVQNSLVMMQDSAFNFLVDKQMCRRGIPDSPIFAIRLFLEECASIQELFSMNQSWKIRCRFCVRNNANYGSSNKTVISFQKLPQNFNPSAPYSLSPCIRCNNLLMKALIMNERMPESLIYHFEEGMRHNDILRYDFQHQNSSYIVKGLIQFTEVKKKKHFVTWIRDPTNNLWLNCNDLQTKFSLYSSSLPDVKPAEIHLILWERVSVGVNDSLRNAVVSNHRIVEGNTANHEWPLMNKASVLKTEESIKPISLDNKDHSFMNISENPPSSELQNVKTEVVTSEEHLLSINNIQIVPGKEMTMHHNNGNNITEDQKNGNTSKVVSNDGNGDLKQHLPFDISLVPVTPSTSSPVPPVTVSSSLTITLIEQSSMTTSSPANSFTVTSASTISPVNTVTSPYPSIELPNVTTSPFKKFLSFQPCSTSRKMPKPVSKLIKTEVTLSPMHKEHSIISPNFRTERQSSNSLENEHNSHDCRILPQDVLNKEADTKSEDKKVEIPSQFIQNFKSLIHEKCSSREKKSILKEGATGVTDIGQSQSNISNFEMEDKHSRTSKKNNSDANLKMNHEDNVPNYDLTIDPDITQATGNLEIPQEDEATQQPDLLEHTTNSRSHRKLFVADTKPSEKLKVKEQVKNVTPDAQHNSNDSKPFHPEAEDVAKNLLQVLSNSSLSITVQKVDLPLEGTDVVLPVKKSDKLSLLASTKRTYSRSRKVSLAKNGLAKNTLTDFETSSDETGVTKKVTRNFSSPSCSHDLKSLEQSTAKHPSLNKSTPKGKEKQAILQNDLQTSPRKESGVTKLAKKWGIKSSVSSGLKQLSPKIINSNQQDENTLPIICDPQSCNMQQEEFVIESIPGVFSPTLSNCEMMSPIFKPSSSVSTKKRIRRSSTEATMEIKPSKVVINQKKGDDILPHTSPIPSSIIDSLKDNIDETTLLHSPSSSKKQNSSLIKFSLTTPSNKGTTTPTVICLKPASMNQVAVDQENDVCQTCPNSQEMPDQENSTRTGIADNASVLSQNASVEVTDLPELVVTNVNSSKRSQMMQDKNVENVKGFCNLGSVSEKNSNGFVEHLNMGSKISETGIENDAIKDLENTTRSLSKVKQFTNSKRIVRKTRKSSRSKKLSVSLADFVFEEKDPIKPLNTSCLPMEISVGKSLPKKNRPRRTSDKDDINYDISNKSNTNNHIKITSKQLSPKTVKAKAKGEVKSKQNIELPGKKFIKKRVQHTQYFLESEDETIAASSVSTLYNSAKKYERPKSKETETSSLDGNSFPSSEQENFVEKGIISNVGGDVSKCSKITALNKNSLLTTQNEESSVSITVLPKKSATFKQATIQSDKILSPEGQKPTLQNSNGGKNIINDNQVTEAMTLCSIDGSEELAGILKAVEDFQLPNVSKTLPDLENLALCAKPLTKKKAISNVTHISLINEKEGTKAQTNFSGASESSPGVSLKDNSENLLNACIIRKIGESEAKPSSTAAVFEIRYTQSPSRTETFNDSVANEKVCKSVDNLPPSSTTTGLNVHKMQLSDLSKISHSARDTMIQSNQTSKGNAMPATKEENSINHKKTLNGQSKLYLIPISPHKTLQQTEKSLCNAVPSSTLGATMENFEKCISTPTKKKRVAARKQTKIFQEKCQFVAHKNSSISLGEKPLQKEDLEKPENEVTSGKYSRSQIRTYSKFSKQTEDEPAISIKQPELAIVGNSFNNNQTIKGNQKIMKSVSGVAAVISTETGCPNADIIMPDAETENRSPEKSGCGEANFHVPSPLRHLSQSHIEKIQCIVNERKRRSESGMHINKHFDNKATQTYKSNTEFSNLPSNKSHCIEELKKDFDLDNPKDRFMWEQFSSGIELSLVPESTCLRSMTKGLAFVRTIDVSRIRRERSIKLAEMRADLLNFALDSQNFRAKSIPTSQQSSNIHHKNENRSVLNLARKRSNDLSVEILPGCSVSRKRVHSPPAKKFKNVSFDTHQNLVLNSQYNDTNASIKCKQTSNIPPSCPSRGNVSTTGSFSKKLQNVPDTKNTQTHHKLNPTVAITEQSAECSPNFQHVDSVTSDFNSPKDNSQGPSNKSSNTSSRPIEITDLQEKELLSKFSPIGTSIPYVRLTRLTEIQSCPPPSTSCMVSNNAPPRDSVNCEQNISFENTQSTINAPDISCVVPSPPPPPQKDAAQQYKTDSGHKSQAMIDQQPSLSQITSQKPKRRVGRPRKNKDESANIVAETNDSPLKKLPKRVYTKKPKPGVQDDVALVKRPCRRKAPSESTDDDDAVKMNKSNKTKKNVSKNAQKNEIMKVPVDSNMETSSSAYMTAIESTVLRDSSSSSNVRRDTKAHITAEIDDYFLNPTNLALRTKM